jgi:urea transport system substrate-binding protein
MVEEAGSFDIRLLKRVFGRTLQQKTARGTEANPVVGSRHPVHVALLDGYEFSILAAL